MVIHRRLLAAALAVGILAANPRAEAASVGFYGVASLAGNASTPPGTPLPPSYSGLWNFGLGGFIRGSGLIYNIELGAQVLKRSYKPNNTGNFDYKVLEVPILIRIAALPILNIGFGVFSAFRMGNVESSSGVLTPSLRAFDWGLAAALGFEMPFGPIALLMEGRYLFGIADLDQSGNDFKSRQLQFVGGVKLGF